MLKHLNYLFFIALSLSAVPFNRAYGAELVADNAAVLNEEVCPICQDPLANDAPLTQLGCHHNIHTECLKDLCKPHLIGGTPTPCPLCRASMDEAVMERLNLRITDSDICQFLTVDIINLLSEDSLNALKNVVILFLNNNDSIAELRAIFSLSEEEAITIKDDLLAFFGPLTLNELRDGSYINRLRALPIFPLVEEAAKILLAGDAHLIRARYQDQAQRNTIGYRIAGKYMHAVVLLARYYHDNYRRDQANQVLAETAHALTLRIININPITAAFSSLAAAHTGAGQEDIRHLINNAEQGTDTWLLSKLYLFTQAWNTMPSFMQNYLRNNPGKKMAVLWGISSAKIAVICAITALLVDLVVRAKIGKIDQKRQERYEDSLLDKNEEEIEQLTPPRRLTPYFSWPIRAYAFACTLAALRVWRVHNMRPL